MFDALAEFAVARSQFGGALLQFAEQPRVLHRDGRLVGNVRTSSICRSLNGSTRCRLSEMTPIGSSSRKSGTPRMVRRPAVETSGHA
jgi:hypothetical protein